MKILTQQNRNEVALEDIEPGKSFWFDNFLYIKTDSFDGYGKDCNCNCVDLMTGKLIYLVDNPMVLLDDELYVTNPVSND